MFAVKAVALTNVVGTCVERHSHKEARAVYRQRESRAKRD